MRSITIAQFHKILSQRIKDSKDLPFKHKIGSLELRKIISDTFTAVPTLLKENPNETIKMRKVGSFKLKKFSEPRLIHNMVTNTGELRIPPNKIKFRPSEALCKELNNTQKKQ
eukprot:gb/GECH01010834.1/.p1 GENE.gb/GECH01010834.1/~~gb/GECH01010834.1/.p1  ORF type:complete len:113 (+),score=14.28 gb/GECH01010834.1/:1-339(+)